VDSRAHERWGGLLGGGHEPGGEKTAGQFRDKARGRVHEFGPGPRRATSNEQGNRRTDVPTNVPILLVEIGRDYLDEENRCDGLWGDGTMSLT
jgi:hypothetical protein